MDAIDPNRLYWFQPDGVAEPFQTRGDRIQVWIDAGRPASYWPVTS